MSIQTRRRISLICSVVLLTALLFLLSWFLIRGAELHFLKEFPTDCDIVCTKETCNLGTGEYESEEFSISPEQLTEVLTLLRKNTYWRIPSSTITHDEDVSYYIYCKFSQDTRQEYLIISFIGNYAISITSSVEDFNHTGFLRILNKGFFPKLEAILTP